MIAGTLEIQMLANMARLADDMNKAKAVVGSAMDKVESAVESAKKALAGLGIALTAEHFAGLIEGAIEGEAHLNELSKATALTVEQLSGLKLLAKQSGSDLDSMAQAISKLSQNIGKEPDRFAALGLSAKDPLENFKRLADIFVQLQDPEQRAAVMATALGKSWLGTAPALAEGSSKIQEMIDKGIDLSGITKQNAEEAENLKNKMLELKAESDSVWTSLANRLVPQLLKAVEAFKQGTEEGGKMLGIWQAIRAFTQQDERQWNLKQMVDVGDEITKLEKAMAEMPKANIPGADIEDLANLKAKYAAHKAIIDAMDQQAAAETAARDQRDANSKADAAATAAQAAAFLEYTKLQERDKVAVKQYTSALQSLEEQQGKLAGQTEAVTIWNRLNAGSLAEVSHYDARHGTELGVKLVAAAKEIDSSHKRQELLKQEIIDMEALDKAREAQRAILIAGRETDQQYLSDLQFQIDLVGKTKDQQQRMTEVRKIDLNLRQQLKAAADAAGENMDDYNKTSAELMKRAQEQKDAVLASTDARLAAERSWVTGAKAAFDEYSDHAKNAAEQAQTVFSNAFHNLEDALVNFVKTGKLDFTSLADSIISDIIRIQVRQAITKASDSIGGASGGWLGSIGAMLGFPGMGGGGGSSAGSMAANLISGSAGEGIMPFYAQGTDFVPRDGPAFLHRGEEVVSVADRGKRDMTVQNYFQITGQTDQRSQAQIAAAAGMGVQRAMDRNL